MQNVAFDEAAVVGAGVSWRIWCLKKCERDGGIEPSGRWRLCWRGKKTNQNRKARPVKTASVVTVARTSAKLAADSILNDDLLVLEGREQSSERRRRAELRLFDVEAAFDGTLRVIALILIKGRKASS